MTAVRAISAYERRVADRDSAVYDMVADLVNAANLSPRRAAELHQVGAERVRHVLDQMEHAVVSAVALEREERAADQHVRGACSKCSRWSVRFGVCRGFRAIRRLIDQRHHVYRRACRRLEAGS